jgi:hypothetical protein
MKKIMLTKRSVHLTKILFTLLMIFVCVPILQAQQFKLIRTPTTGNTVTLTTHAKIMRITRKAESYSIWKNGKAFINISQKHDVKGVLPPGAYILRTSPGGSVTIDLDTNYRPENIVLWGRQHKIVKPGWEGNYITIRTPAKIIAATYDGTDGMGIFNGRNRILFFLSPHNHFNPGPLVIGGIGGKTLIGQTLPPGVYYLVPGRGTADGIVYGQITLDVR